MKRENLIAHSKCQDDDGSSFVKLEEKVRAMCWWFDVIQIYNIVVDIVNIVVKCAGECYSCSVSSFEDEEFVLLCRFLV